MQRFLVAFGIALLAFAAYAVTFDVPWYMDDFSAITGSERIRDLDRVVRDICAPRGLGDFTFALNHRVGGFDVFGYHLVNTIIHASAGVLVAALLRRFDLSMLLSFVGGAIFVLHPVQTQAVTYIVQRYASLAGLFFLAAVWLYLVARDAGRNEKRRPVAYAAYIAALFCGWAAVYTKQNAAVLPVVLFVLDRFLLEEREPVRVTLLRIAPFFVAPLWAAWGQLVAPVATGRELIDLTGTDTFSGTRVVTPFNYFLTELGVLWRYIGLLLLPLGQRLDYDVPLATGVTLRHIILGGGLLALLAAAFRFRNRFPFMAAGIFWFFLTLAIESSVIPLDLMFEHRLYLPVFGFVLCLMEGLRRVSDRTVLAITIPLLLCYGSLTLMRNQLWRDQKALFEDNLRKSPLNPRPYLPVAKIYLKEGKPREAIALLEKALPLDPFSYLAYDCFGVAYHMLGNLEQSISHFRTALTLKPDFPDAHTNLGTVFADQQKWPEAEAAHRRALKHRPLYGIAWYNLGVALFNQQKAAESFDAFRKAAELQPTDADSLFNAAVSGIEAGNADYARKALPRLQGLNADRARALSDELRKLQRQ